MNIVKTPKSPRKLDNKLDNIFWFGICMGEAAAHIQTGFFNVQLRDKEYTKARVALLQAELIAEVGLRSQELASHPRYFLKLLEKGWWGEANQQIRNFISFISFTKISREAED